MNQNNDKQAVKAKQELKDNKGGKLQHEVIIQGVSQSLVI